MTGRNTRRKRAGGFTLIEILVVLGISMILLGLILGPIVQSFGLTRRAQVMVNTQNTARQTLERVSREISEAMSVYDNTQSPISFPVPVWTVGSPTPDSVVNFQVYGAKIDLLLPKLIMHCNNADHPAGAPRYYERGKVVDGRFYAEAWPSCPVCGSNNVEARPATPRQPDTKIVRYFIGLADNDPSKFYVNSYDENSGTATVRDPDNTYLLYRAEFELSDDRLCPGNIKDEEVGDYLRNAPNFFYESAGSKADSSVPVWKQWRKVAMVVGPKQDIDFVRVQWNVSGSAHTPAQVTPAVRFTPSGVDNDALAATYVSDSDAEEPSSTPTAFRAAHGLWCPGFRVVVYTNDLGTHYSTRVEGGDLCIFKNGTDLVFNIDEYHRNPDGELGRYPEGPELMFTVDPDKGLVSFAFPYSFVLDEKGIQDINAAFKSQFEDSLNFDGRGQGIRQWFVPSLPGGSRIVPGTETLVAPDMMPGARYGQPTRYKRVPWNMGDPGRNQYKINYDSGEIQFSSLWEEHIPEVSGGAINLTFQMHNNSPGMVVKADYASKMLLSIDLAMRMYDHASGGKLHVVELSNRIRLRNAMR